MVKLVEKKEVEKEENKTYQDIYDTVNQSNLRSGNPSNVSGSNPLDQLDQFEEEPKEKQLDEPPAPYYPEVPTPPPQMYSYEGPQNVAAPPQESSSQIQEIVESVIEEKWEDILTKVGDISLWKERVGMELTAIKQEIIRTQTQFMNLQKAVLGKVDDYNKNIMHINTEMKALERVFQKILEPLTNNVKELSKITAKFKKK